jgi:hypothetical protein
VLGGEYDLVQAIRDLRNIQVAHSLIPHTDPTEHLWAHHLSDFADNIFSFMVELEGDLTEATGIALDSLRNSADRFRDNALWQLIVTERTPAEEVWKRRQMWRQVSRAEASVAWQFAMSFQDESGIVTIEDAISPRSALIMIEDLDRISASTDRPP